MGQLYLVTVVALLVGRLTHKRAERLISEAIGLILAEVGSGRLTVERRPTGSPVASRG